MPASATFVATDNTTVGSWIGVYGADGYAFVNGTLGNSGPEDATDEYVSTPAYATWGSSTGINKFTYTTSTADTRALQAPGGASRVAGVFYGSAYTVNLTISGAVAKRLRIYCLDWDSSGRAITVSIADHAGGALDSQSVSSYSGGKWLSWDILGDVDITITTTSGPNGTISGFFFDSAGGGSTDYPVSVTYSSTTGLSESGAAGSLAAFAPSATTGFSGSAASSALASASFAITPALAEACASVTTASLGLTCTAGGTHSGASTSSASATLTATAGYTTTTGQAIQVALMIAGTLGLSQAATASLAGLVTHAATLGYSTSGQAGAIGSQVYAAAVAVAQLAQAASKAGLSLGIASSYSTNTFSGGVSPILLFIYQSGQYN